MADFETVTVRRDGAAATIVLDRPEALNAWNRQLGSDLLAALRDAAGDDAVRAVRLTGAGRAFSSGADLRDITAMEEERTAEGDPDVQRLLRERYHPIITLVREMPKPVLAAVNGPAAGIGASLALASDLVIAAESAYLLLAFVNIGLVPDGGSSLLVPSRVGFARAAEMAMLGERIPAPKALDWGLINRVVEPESLPKEALELAQQLAAGPTKSYAGSKRALNQMLYGNLDAQLELEADIQHELFRTNDVREGVTAFIEKRDAAFTGS
jgi:2-(1,2-epoxy-1,2-dihydrophenyl)acetyl-CoA isomerase